MKKRFAYEQNVLSRPPIFSKDSKKALASARKETRATTPTAEARLPIPQNPFAGLVMVSELKPVFRDRSRRALLATSE